MFHFAARALKTGLCALLLISMNLAADAPGETAVAVPASVVGRPDRVESLEWGRHSGVIYTTGNGLGAWNFSIRAGTVLSACTLFQLQRLEHHANSMAVGSRTSAVVLGTNVGVVELRDGSTLQVEKTFDIGRPYSVYAVAIDSGEQRIAACATDGTVFIWDVDREAPLHHLGGTDREGERMASLAFSPDGETLAALSRYGRLTLWDVASGNQIGEAADNAGGETSALQFTPEGNRVVVVDRAEILFWHPIDEPKPRVIIPPEEVCPRYADEPLDGSRLEYGHGIRFAGVATLSRDGKRVAQIVEDGGVAIWDVESKDVLLRLPPPAFATAFDHPGSFFARIRISPDGRRVAAAASTGEMVIWPVPEI